MDESAKEDRAPPGAEFALHLGGLTLRTVDAGAPPGGGEGLVQEEDTYLIMSTEPVVDFEVTSVHKLMRDADEMARDSPVPGLALVRRRKPRFKVSAIVYDLNAETPCQPEWVSSALGDALDQADAHRVQALRLPLLGTTHGTLTPRGFIDLLRRTIEERNYQHLAVLSLAVHPRDEPGVQDALVDAFL